ncbi:MAG: D-alanyl-D-alanine carboxypeptidase [Clostridiales bacterium]|nr:D-alanyl-D-alanine carboxypeptidase [Clostridiales bacterium]
MKKTLPCLLLALILAASSVTGAQAAALDLAAPSAILMEAATGTVLYESNAHERLRPASVTKIMTLLLVMEALEDGRISWDDTITTSSAAAAKGGSQIYLEENEQLSFEEMLKSVVVSSANDCATALAEHVAGSESAFVGMMNERAAELGMQDTHFVNCTGLDDEPEAAEHLTSAWDIAIMSRELLKHSEIKKYTTIWMDTVRNGEFGLSNTNKLVRFYDGTTGLKTGYTSAAGYCLSASAERGGMELIAVVLHCQSSTDRFESAKALLNYGFSNYALVTPQPQAIGSVPVVLGKSDALTPVPETSEPILIDKALAAGIQTEVQLDESVTAPVAEGQRLGTMTVRSGDKALAEIALVAPARVEALTFWDVFTQLLGRVCMAE